MSKGPCKLNHKEAKKNFDKDLKNAGFAPIITTKNPSISEINIHNRQIEKNKKIADDVISKWNTTLYDLGIESSVATVNIIEYKKDIKDGKNIVRNILVIDKNEEVFKTIDDLRKQLGAYENREPLATYLKSAQADIYLNSKSPDKRRRIIDNNLNNLLIKTLERLTIEAVGEDGTVENKKIQLQTIERYKKWHSEKYKNSKGIGEEIDAIGVANIFDAILAYTEEDGITLPEEAIHFLLLAIENQPEIIEILTSVDDKGVRIFEKTKEYRESYDGYFNKYGSREKAEREILGTIVANYMYDVRRSKTLYSRIMALLHKVFSRIFTGWKLEYQENLSEYSIEMRKILGIIDSKISTGEYLNHNSTIRTELISSTEEFGSSSQKLSVLAATMRDMANRQKLLLQDINSKGSDYVRYRTLFNTIGIATSPTDGPHTLTMDRLDKFETSLKSRLGADPQNPALHAALEQFKELRKLFITFQDSSERSRILSSMEKRLSQIKKFQALKEYEEGLNAFIFGVGNVKGKTSYDDYDYGEHGALYDLEKADDRITQLMKLPELIRPEHINMFLELHKTYKMATDMIEIAIEDSVDSLGYTGLFKGDILRNKRVQVQVNRMKAILETLDNFVNNEKVHYHAKVNMFSDTLNLSSNAADIEEAKNFVSYTDAKQYLELGTFRKNQGLYMNSRSNWLKVFDKKIKTIDSVVERETRNSMLDFYSKIKDLGYESLSPSEIMRVFYQLDEKGNTTGYINTEWDIDGWEKSRLKFKNSVIGMLEEKVRASNNPLINTMDIPEKYSDLMRKFLPVYSFSNDKQGTLTPEQLALWQVRDMFDDLWRGWDSKNNEILSRDEREDLKSKMYNRLPYYHYQKWLSKVEKTYTRSDGVEEVFYSGEFLRPKAKNPRWNSLSDNQKEIAREYANYIRTLKLSTGSEMYSFELISRAPQISRTFTEATYSGNRLKTAGERLSRTFNHKVDEDFYNKDEDNQLIKFPPFRWNEKIEDPTLLTPDVIKALTMYTHGVMHKNNFTKAMPELQGMIDMVELGKVKVDDSLATRAIKNLQKYLTLRKGENFGGNSNLVEGMESVMQSVVYGDKEDLLLNSEALTAFMRTGIGYVSTLNLAYNVPAIITSYVSGEIDKINFAISGDYGLDPKGLAYAQNEMIKNITGLSADFASPVKRTKIGALADLAGVGGGIKDSMKETNLNRAARGVKSMVEPFSGWNMADYITSLPIPIVVARNFRKINGVWMSKQAFNRSNLDKSLWEPAENMYDYITVGANGVLNFKDIPDNIISLYMVQAKHVSEMVAQVISDNDKGMWHRNVFGRLVYTHMKWFMIQGDRMFKESGYDFINQQGSGGYYRLDSLSYFKDVSIALARDGIMNGLGMKIDSTTFKDLMDVQLNPNNEYKIRNVKRIASLLTGMTIISMLSFIAVAVARGYDDDDSVTGILVQLLALMLIKANTELGSQLSLKDMNDFAKNPLNNYDTSYKRFYFINTIVNTLFGVEDKVSKSNDSYIGMSREHKRLIKSTPYLKNIFENYGSWFINKHHENNIGTMGRSFASKRDNYIKLVVEDKPNRDMFMGIPDAPARLTRIFGNSLGSFFLQVVGIDDYKSESTFNLKYPVRTEESKRNPTSRQRAGKKRTDDILRDIKREEKMKNR